MFAMVVKMLSTHHQYGSFFKHRIKHTTICKASVLCKLKCFTARFAHIARILTTETPLKIFGNIMGMMAISINDVFAKNA